MSAGFVSPEIAYYSASVADFLGASPEEILGQLVKVTRTVEEPQRNAWLAQIGILKRSLTEVTGALFFEYVVPRIGSRIDSAVLVQSGRVVAIHRKDTGSRARYRPLQTIGLGAVI